MKAVFLHGITAGLLSALSSLIYNYAYSTAFMVDFSQVISIQGIIAASLFGTVLASLGYYALSFGVIRYKDIWFNAVYLVLTFTSFVVPFGIELPLDLDAPELFPGLSIPMHIFPALFWLATKPLFYKS